MKQYQSAEEVNFLTAKEVARRTGYSRRHIYNLVESGELGHRRLSKRRIQIPEEEFLKWANKKNIKPD